MKKAQLALIFVSLSLCASAFAQTQENLEIHRLRPVRIGLGSALVKTLHHFRTPYINEVKLNGALVGSLLPDTLTANLHRPGAGKLKTFLMSPTVILKAKRILRHVEVDSDLHTSEDLASLLPNLKPHTFALTGEHLNFALTAPNFGDDLMSKHAIISHNYTDVRMAGQLWREGDTLCFNGNSGTYMKKRKDNGLEESPDPSIALPIFKSVFEPALKVKLCRFIAPEFGPGEAVDQAQKAELAVEDAKAALSDTKTPAALATQLKDAITATEKLIDEAYDASEKAYAAKGTDQWSTLDETAGEAALSVKEKGRKKIEKLLKKLNPSFELSAL